MYMENQKDTNDRTCAILDQINLYTFKFNIYDFQWVMLDIFCSVWLFVERSPSAQSEVFGGVEHRRNQEFPPVFLHL